MLVAIYKSSTVSNDWNLNACNICLSSFQQSGQNSKKKEDPDADDEKIEEEDSHFMKLAKKVTAKKLQRKGPSDKIQKLNNDFFFLFSIQMAAMVCIYTMRLPSNGG